MNIGMALMGVFVAEFITSERGVGHAMLKAGSLYDMSEVFVGIIMISALAGIMQWMLSAVTRLRFSRFKPK